MSDETKFEDPIHKQMDEKAAFIQKKEDVAKKELIVRERRAENAVAQIEESDKNTAIAKNTDYGRLSPEEIADKQKENTAYMKAAKEKMPFINESFDHVMPFFRKNLILIGAKSGEGKSTTVANIVRETIRHTNKHTGARRRVLVLTNEEVAPDVYNRVTCLIKGWSYVNHDKFTEEQVKVFNEYFGFLADKKLLTVIGDHYNGASGTTTTLEGICQVFDNLIANKEWYDAVIIDYFQNIKESRLNPMLEEYKVQAALVGRLDKYKNVYPAPIVVLAQLMPGSDENASFRSRIEGRKSIFNVSTTSVEIIPNREECTTEWLFHKSRFNESVGKKVITGYDRGQYVPYTEAFKEKVQRMHSQQRLDDANRACGMDAPKAEEDEEEIVTPEVKKEGTNDE